MPRAYIDICDHGRNNIPSITSSQEHTHDALKDQKDVWDQFAGGPSNIKNKNESTFLATCEAVATGAATQQATRELSPRSCEPLLRADYFYTVAQLPLGILSFFSSLL
jgi:hypothetical protein